MNKLSLRKLVIANITAFLRMQASSGVILMACAAAAVFFANSAMGPAYQELLATKLGFSIFGFELRLSLQHWINDLLMALFFFVVGMEIKHELIDGALASFDRAILPVLAALGGMIAPALIYFAFVNSGPAASGWGIPMATDIAFAVGVMALLGSRVPPALKIFLLALAIADDLGAVLVIALFYTSDVNVTALITAAVLCGTAWYLGRLNMRWVGLHIAIGLMVWLAVHESGVHATVAGVVLGFLMPHEDSNPDDPTPLERWVGRLAPISTFVVMPIFALANAGVDLSGITGEALLTDPLVSGVSYGLLLGKPLGIFLTCWIACKLGFARLGEGMTFPRILGAGMLGGIGFTMALFIASLALTSPEHLTLAKMGILKGSILSAVVGSIFLYVVGAKSPNEMPSQTWKN